MKINIQPTTWPQDSTVARKSSPFQHRGRATAFGQTMALLESELKHVKAKEVWLKTGHSPDDIRLDGNLRSDSRTPKHPGVILLFQKAAGWNAEEARYEYVEMRMPCDTFVDWKTNVRAIALALEALRKIDRYGVATGAQYAGYKALPAGDIGVNGFSPELAADFIAKAAGMGNVPSIATSIIQNSPFAESVYKTAAKSLHPDKGGDAKEFAKLEQCMTMIRELQKAVGD